MNAARGSKAVRCDLCEVTCTSKEEYNNHVNGRRHLAMVSKLSHSHERDERTLFVKGDRASFDKLSDLALSDYFSSVGEIASVRYLKDRGFAFVEFVNKLSVDKALGIPNHVVRVGNFQCRLTVRFCRHSTPQQIIKQAEQHRKRTLEKEEVFRNIKETTLPTFDEFLAAVGDNADGDLATQLAMLATEVGLTDESVSDAQKCARRAEQLVNSFITQEGEEAICRAAIFGSKISSFGLRSSDLDVVLYFNSQQTLPPELMSLYFVESHSGDADDSEESLEIPARKMRLMTKLERCGTSLADKPAARKIRFIADMLSCTQDFSNILAISARIPIVRCLYQPTASQIDISVDSLLSVNNSHLLRLYSFYDQRIRPLVIAVRYWAKMQGICPAHTFMSSYALTWLVLYFLQTRNPPVCPTVAQLAEISRKAGEPDLIVSTWNSSYPIDLAKWPMTQNVESLNDLFPKFFDFYANFSFAENAIILRDASTAAVQTLVSANETSVKKGLGPKKEQMNLKKTATRSNEAGASHLCNETDASDDHACCCHTVKVKGEPCVAEDNADDVNDSQTGVTTLEETLEDNEDGQTQMFRISVMNVQDPIELTRNITASTTERNLEKILGAFKAAAKLFHAHDGKDPQSILKRLFTKQEIDVSVAKAGLNDKPKNAQHRSLFIGLSPNNSSIQSRSLEWFRQIRFAGISLRWLCSAVSAIGAIHLLRNVLLVDVVLVENKIPPEVWHVVNSQLANCLGIVNVLKAAIVQNTSSDVGLLPIFVPAAVGASSQVVPPTKLEGHEIFFELNCTARFPTWQQREEMATAMRRQGRCPTGPDGQFENIVKDYGLALETQISKWIAYGGESSTSASQAALFPVSFSLTVSSCQSAVAKNADEVRLELKSASATPPKMFSLIGSFVTKRFTDAIGAM